MSHLPETLIALGVAIAAVWLPGALVIHTIEAMRRRGGRARTRPMYVAGPMQDL